MSSAITTTKPRESATGRFRERSLFDREERDIQQRFEAFDAAHPEVWRLFMQFAGDLLAAGHKHYSADAILHRIRWHYSVEHRAGTFKITDHFSSRYGRKLRDADPARFKDFFEFRNLKS